MHKPLRTLVLSLAGALALCASVPGWSQQNDLPARIKANKEITAYHGDCIIRVGQLVRRYMRTQTGRPIGRRPGE
jgi:hypothetical protein